MEPAIPTCSIHSRVRDFYETHFLRSGLVSIFWHPPKFQKVYVPWIVFAGGGAGPEIIAKLPVESISLDMGGRVSQNSIDFLLDGYQQSIINLYVTKEIRQAAEQSLKGYFVLYYQRGPWTSYVINDWDFVLDTSNR